MLWQTCCGKHARLLECNGIIVSFARFVCAFFFFFKGSSGRVRYALCVVRYSAQVAGGRGRWSPSRNEQVVGGGQDLFPTK